MNGNNEYLEKLFNPNSIAVIGVSKTPGKIGHDVMSNIVGCGFRGPLYPVSHKYAEVQDIRCYKSILDVTDEIDLAVVLSPEDFVPKVLEELGVKGVKVVAVLSGSREGPLKDKIAHISRKYGIRIIGPSSLGIYHSKSRLNATPIALNTGERGVALISESKALGISMVSYGLSEGIGFSAVIGTGGKADIAEQDLLDYLSMEDEVKSILVHIDTLNDPKELIEALRRAVKRKPVAVITGSRGVSKKLESLKKDVPIFSDFVTAFDFSALFTGRGIVGRRTLVITNSRGAENLLMAYLENSPIELPELNKKFVEDVRMFTPDGSSLSNPMNLTSEAGPEIFREVIECANLHGEEFDFILALYCETNRSELEKFGEILIEIKDLTSKPIIPIVIGGEKAREIVKELRRAGISSYYTLEGVGKSLGTLMKYLM